VAVDGQPVVWKWEMDRAILGAWRQRPERITFTAERDGREGAAPERRDVALPVAAATTFQLGVTTEFGHWVRAVAADSPLATAGLRVGDLVTTVGQAAVREGGFAKALEQAAGETKPCTILREGTTQSLELPTTSDAWASVTAEPAVRVAAVIPESPAAEAGLAAGWMVLAVGTTAPDRFATLQKAIAETRGGSLTLRVHVPGEAESREVTARPWVRDAASFGVVSVRVHKERARLGLGAALAKGWEGTVKFAEQVLLTFRSLAQRRVSADNLGGPVTIVNVAYAFTEEGIGAILYFLGILSVNLAILNVLPIPVLDGGHLFFLLIEAVRRRPVSENVQVMAQYVGLLLLLALMVFVTYNDIGRLF
jgi:regulator of sigma E protease